MASDQTLRAIITVLDQTAEPLRRINERFRTMSAPLREIHSRLGEIGEQSGLKNLAEHSRLALERVRGLGEGLFELLTPLAALGAVGSIAGLGEIVKKTTEYSEKLGFSAIQTGLSTKAMASWHYAAGIANIDAQQLDRSFTYLNRRIAEAASGKAKDVQSLLLKLGMHNAPGHIADTADALGRLTWETKHLIDTGQTPLATQMLSTMLGERMGARLMPLFGKGQDWIGEMFTDAAAHGLMPTKEETQGALEFEEAYKGMSGAVLGLQLAIGNQLFPSLTDAVKGMSAWMDANRPWLAQQIGDAVKEFGTYLKGIDWKGVIGGMREFGSAAAWAYNHLGGMTLVLGGIAALTFGPAIASFASLGGAIAQTVAVVGAALLANPIAAAILGVAVAGGIAGYEIYEHWDTIKAKAIETWGSVTASLSKAAKLIADAWRPEVEFFRVLWNDIDDVFTDAWKRLEPITDKMRDAAMGLWGYLTPVPEHVPGTPWTPAQLRAHAASTGAGAGGPVLGQIVGSLRAGGATDAVIQGVVAAALGEGGVWQGWKPGDNGTSFGPWQLHQGGRLDAYLAGGGQVGDVAAQTRYVLATMERLHPGFRSQTDPDAVVREMHDRFLDYGASPVNLAPAGDLLAKLAAGGGLRAGGALSHTKVTLDLQGLPRNTRPAVEHLGHPADLDLNLGYAMPF
jgi:hypothetical protein